MTNSPISFTMYSLNNEHFFTDQFYHVLSQQRTLLKPPQQYRWDQMIEKTLTNPKSQQKLQGVMEDIMNANLARYRKPITLANYQKRYGPNKIQAVNDHYKDDAPILELLNVIENKLINLIQTNFYS